MVSLDGGSEEVHDALRGPGAFKEMIRGLGYLIERVRPDLGLLHGDPP